MSMTHFRHFLNAFGYSLSGLHHAYSSGTAFRQEVCVLCLLCVVSALANITGTEQILLLSGWIAVMALELLNSAIEDICNLISPQRNPHIKAIKDMASAAVMLAIVSNVGIWTAVFLL